MEGGGRLELVPANGDSGLARDAVETGFVILLEIWHSALGELVGEVPPGQLRVLLIVSRAGSVSIGRLAGALGASVPAANRICTRMEAAGLLGRSGSAAGGDVPVFFLTAPARRLVAQIREQRHARAPVAVARGPRGAGERAGRVRRQLRLTGSVCRPPSRPGGR
jgi:DNA-binding MarR family transcriptional regulator